MNTQNILRFYGSKLDIKLDSSEYYDYELSKVQGDYATDILDLNTPITYSSLVVNDSLEDFDPIIYEITLLELDLSQDIPNYVYSNLTFNLNYSDFINHFNTTGYSYSDIILNNHIFTYTGIPGEIHYFRIIAYNEPIINYFSNPILDFTTDIIDCITKLTLPSYCCGQAKKLDVKPWAYKIDTGSGSDNCSPLIKRRTEDGWTLDFVFNREGFPWSYGNKFYYFGVRGDDDVRNYADNNLSFGFTDDGRIVWTSVHYSGFCDASVSAYTEMFYTINGYTPQLCTQDPYKDFNITIVFDRYKHLTDCNLENDGGWNDLILEKTLNNSPLNIVTGSTPDYTLIEKLNSNWLGERNSRLGTLKIYLNGRPIYKIENWEEIIPSYRGVQPFIQSWGGGTGLMNGVHEGVCNFNIKTIQYYEEPLDYLHVRHNFLMKLKDLDFGNIVTQNLEKIYTDDYFEICYQPITTKFDFEICGINNC
jgi:hypothetical protein